MKKSELHLFILWEKARIHEQKILKDISTKFEILRVFNQTWSEDMFSNNLSRLYGKRLLKSHKKKEKAGSGAFLTIVVRDNNPLMIDGINSKPFESKSLYRQWTGGGHLVHCSDNIDEAEENMMFLLGLNSKEFLAKYNSAWDGSYININQEIIGSPEWNNETSFQNFIKKIPEATVKSVQNTLLITHQDVQKISRLLNATKKLFFMRRNMYQVPINGKNKMIYIRKPI